MGLKWLGQEKGQEGIPGIPGRDLTDREIEERGLDRKQLVMTGLYEEEKPKRAQKKED